MLELARHAELHAAGVIEYFDNFDEHSEGAMFGRTIRRLVCSDNTVPKEKDVTIKFQPGEKEGLAFEVSATLAAAIFSGLRKAQSRLS